MERSVRRSRNKSACGWRIFASLAAFFLFKASVGAATFSTSLDRETVILGENVTLTLKFEGVQTGGMPQLPAVPGLQPAGGTSSGFNSSTGPDGKTQVVQTFATSYVADQVGEIVIPAFTVEAAGQKFSSAPLKLKVLREDPSAPPAYYATNQVFLWLVLPRPEAYVGEVLVPELRLYLRSEISQIDQLNIPPLTGEGFLTSAPQRTSQYRRRVGNASYNVVAMNLTLSPVKSGLLEVGPVKGETMIFGGAQDFFGRYRQSAQVAFESQPLQLRVLSVPRENAPASFTGAVGDYAMNVSVGPTNVAAGDPITVRVQITGRGALNSIALPEQAAWTDFKSYPPTARVETTDALGIQGTKTFEQVISPESADIKSLPAFSFSFFNPETKTFRTLAHPETKLTVRPGGAVVAPTIAATGKSSANEAAPAPIDIVPIKQRLGTVSRSNAPWLSQPSFLALQTAPILAFLAAFVWRRRVDSLANNPRLRRQRAVALTIRNGLIKLREAASRNGSEDFFAEVFRLLQERLGERLDCPATAITEAVIEEKLRPRGASESTLDGLQELFQLCNQARYAPVRSAQELAAVIPKVEQTLKSLEEVRS